MTFLDSEDDPLVVGDDYDVERQVVNVQTTDPLSIGRLTIRERKTSASMLLQKVITTAADSNGQITDTGADGTGSVFFQLSDDDTSILETYRMYFYDIELETQAGKIFTRERGILIPRTQITIGVTSFTPPTVGTPLIEKSVVPSGTINGVNVTFTLPEVPYTGSVRLYQNKLRLLPTTDYSVSGLTITMVTAPIAGDVLLADYETT